MNKAFEAAKRKGAAARDAGQKRNMCPYPDHRGDWQNSVTWSRAFGRYWYEGYDERDLTLSRERGKDLSK